MSTEWNQIRTPNGNTLEPTYVWEGLSRGGDKVNMSTESSQRKRCPAASGVLDYFPDAIIAISAVSYVGSQQHNPGEPMRWDRSKSSDQADCLIRHFLERGKIDKDGLRHSAKVAWRALALLQIEIEKELADSPKTIWYRQIERRFFEPRWAIIDGKVFYDDDIDESPPIASVTWNSPEVFLAAIASGKLVPVK